MASPRPLKKNDTIEIRLSDQTKADFMERCRHEQRTASETIRRFIEDQLAPPSDRRPRRTSSWRMLVAAAAGVVLGIGMAGPSLARSSHAHSSDDNRAAFDRLDRNHDGMLSYREYRTR